MNKKIKLLCLFDYNGFTGFATVSGNLVHNWRKRFGANINIDIVAINYFGEDYNAYDNVRVISAKKKDIKADDFGRHVFLKSVATDFYDVIFIMQDLGVVQSLIPHMKKIIENRKVKKQKLFKTIFYFPIDCALPQKLTIGLDYFDVLATYTDFGKNELLLHLPHLKNKINVIPHGNNSKNFYPLPEIEKQTFRKEYFGANADKFIIGCVNRNQQRKDIPTTIFGFMEYKQLYNNNCFLYLHMNPNDPMGWKLRLVLEQTPLIEGVDYMFPNEDDYNKGASVDKLNKIMNCFDVFLTTATGGGWELTVTEAMGVKVPTIIPNHTSFITLGGINGKNTYFIETLYPIVSTFDNIIRLQSDLDEIAVLLNTVQHQIEFEYDTIKGKIENAYKFVNGLNWEDISNKFADKIKALA